MIADGAYYPFNAGNVIAEPRPLMTSTYFNDSGDRGINSSGNFIKTTVGYGTNWPIGLFTSAIYDLWANAKMLAYHIDIAFLSAQSNEVGIATAESDDLEQLGAQGVLRRCFVSSGSIFKHALKSFPRQHSATGKTTTDDFIIDFTKSFFDYRSGAGSPRRSWWFPYIRLNIAGSTGFITNGSDMSATLDFQGMPIPPMPIDVRSNVPGVPIDDPIVFRSDIQLLERYDAITFTPKEAVAGVTPVTITLPAYNPAYDHSAWRDGFVDVTELTFGRVKTTDFQKVANAGGVIDTIVVIPPVGSKTDVIRFKSVVDPLHPEKTTDYYATVENLKIT
jgi:hypothetical protein